jgi:hypothetical protein
MRTIKTKVYQFSELSDEAKEKALSNWLESCEYFWGSEVVETVKKACEIYGFRLKNYSIDWNNINGCSYTIDSEHSDEILNLSGVRLWKYLVNNYSFVDLSGNCPFTGVCFDEDFLDNIREFLKKPNSQNFEDLITDSVYNTINSGCKDFESQQTEEYFADHAHANNYEFIENGERI